MSLPYAIEYLLTLRRPGGGRLVAQAAFQIMVPILPPHQVVTVNVSPATGEFAHFYYKMGFDLAMIPNSTFATIQQYGVKWVDAVISQDWMLHAADIFVPVTHAEPTFFQLTNMTDLNQYASGTIAYLIIKNEEDYENAYAALARMGTSSKLENLLDRLTGPRGSIVGRSAL